MRKKLVISLLTILSCLLGALPIACSSTPTLNVECYYKDQMINREYVNDGSDFVLPTESELGVLEDEIFMGWYFDLGYRVPFTQEEFKSNAQNHMPLTVYAKIVKRNDLSGTELVADKLVFNPEYGGFEGVFSSNYSSPDFLDIYDFNLYIQVPNVASFECYYDENCTLTNYTGHVYVSGSTFTEFFIKVINGDEEQVYKLRVRKKEKYNVTFLVDGNVNNTVTVEEGDTITGIPQLILPDNGYTREWDYDFSTPINSSFTINATTPVALPDGGRYKVEYYIQSSVNPNNYDRIYTSDFIYTTTDREVTPTQADLDAFSTLQDVAGIYEHFEYNSQASVNCVATHNGHNVLTLKYDRKLYTVNFNLNGGTLVSGETTQQVRYGYKAQAPVFEKRGYTFNGFNTSDFTVLSNYLNFTPVYDLVNYNLTVDLGSYATYEGNIPTSYTVEDVITITAPTRQGYEFIGYSINGSNSLVKTAVISNSVDKVEITANYEAIFTTNVLVSSVTIAGLTDYAIQNCKSIVIPSSIDGKNVTNISSTAFSSVKETLEEIDFTSATVTAIPAFDGFTALKTVKLGEKLTSLPRNAFSGCALLETIIIPENSLIKQISDSAFSGCASLENINLTNLTSLTSIGVSAFNGCKLLTVIDLSNTALTSVTSAAFAGCESVNTVKLPKTITNVSGGFLSAFEGIENVEIHEENAKYKIANGILIDKTTHTAISSLKTVAVTANEFTIIGSNAFENVTVTSLDLTGVTHIYGYAFKGAVLPETITIPNTLQNYYKNCFEGASGVTHVNYLASVVSENTFYNCADLTSVTLASNVTKISASAFAKCYNLSSVNFGDLTSLTTIGNNAFYASSIKAVTIPESVTSIGKGAFAYITNLEEVNYNAKAVTSTNKEVFRNSGSGVSGGFTVKFKETVQKVPAYLFYTGVSTVENVKSVEFLGESQITSIGTYAFANLKNTEAIDISGLKNLTSIGGYAFFYNLALQTAIIPETVTSVGRGAYSCCENVTKITINSVKFNANYDYPLGFIFGTYESSTKSEKTTQKVFTDGHSTVTYYIPTSLNEVEINASYVPYAFFNNVSSVKTVKLGENVQEIKRLAFLNAGVQTVNSYATNLAVREYAFENAQSLKVLNLYGGTISAIERGAFAGCTSIKNVLNENGNGVNITGVTEIGENAFMGCTELVLAKIHGVEKVLDYAFYGCESLLTIGLDSNPILESVGKYAFANCTKLFEMVIPGTQTGYDFILPSSLKTVDKNAFEGCANTSIDGIFATQLETYLGKGSATRIRAPYLVINSINVENVTEVEFVNCTVIGGLQGATNLEKITLPENVLEIADYGFMGARITEFEIPNTVQKIGIYAFANTAVKEMVIPASVVNVGRHVFSETKIQRVTFEASESEVSIEDYAFKDLTHLEKITLPVKYTLYGDWLYSGQTVPTFDGCNNLYLVQKANEVTIPASSFAPNKWDAYSTSQLVFGEDNFVYTEYNEMPLIIGLWGDYPQDIVLPESVNGKDYNIGEYAFENYDDISSITIPSSVKTIYPRAFLRTYKPEIDIYYTGTLQQWVEIKHPTHEDVFFGINKLFINGELLTTVDFTTLADGTEVLNCTFSGIESVTSYIPNDKITVSYSEAFFREVVYEVASVSDSIVLNDFIFVHLGNNSYELVGYVGAHTERLVLPTSVNGYPYDIAQDFMHSDLYLTSLVVSSGVRNIKAGAFTSCYLLSSVEFEEGVVSIVDAFGYCDDVRTLILPDSLVTMEGCFARSNGPAGSWIGYIRYGKNYVGNYNVAYSPYETIHYNNEIKAEIKEDEYRLISINLEGLNASEYSVLGGIDLTQAYCILYANANTVLPYGTNFSEIYFKGTLEEYLQVVVSKQTASDCVYINGELLTEVTVSNNVSSYAYYGIGSLTTVNINYGVTEIGAHAFEHTSLKEVELPDSVTKIGESAFNLKSGVNCRVFNVGGGLKELNANSLPNKIISLVLNAQLSSFVKSEEQDIGEIVFDKSSSSAISGGNYIQLGSGNYIWYAKDVVDIVIDNLSTYGISDAFVGFKNVKSITFKNCDVSDFSLVDLTELETVVIEDSCISTFRMEIKNCPKLKSITIGKNVNYVEMKNLQSLTSLTFNSGGTSTDYWQCSVDNCNALTSIILPDSVTAIITDFVSNCASLQSVYIPANITSICAQAIYNCQNVKEIRFENCYNYCNSDSSISYDFTNEYENATLFIEANKEVIKKVIETE
ncbi:MAG: leucine-rich repeat protein [Clostridia bacterium]|nr:leucine-rich repeat protein [Clostridia bacterium]